jgi:SnoaL-like domain
MNLASTLSSSQHAVQLVLEFFARVWHPPHDLSAIDELMTEDYVITSAGRVIEGREAFKAWVRQFQSQLLNATTESVDAFASPTGASTELPVLRGSALELVDANGQIRGRLNIEPQGEVVLRLLDERGTIRVKLGAGTDGSGLLLANDATAPGIHLLAIAAGSSVRVVNKDGRERLIAP